MIHYDLIIIGAGPAGLFSAVQAVKKQKKILVLEKQPEPGRKLLITGSGQCNFTNLRPIREFSSAYGEHGNFLKPALHYFTNLDTVQFFRRHGVESLVVPENGKVFPKSRRSRDILNLLLALCRKSGVEIQCGQRVEGIERPAGGGFRVLASRAPADARNVLLATGGQSYPETGSTGDGYRLARSLGHSLVAPRPGLTPFFIRDHPLADLSGTSFKAGQVTLWRGHKKIKTGHGDWLVTHQGISGPAVQNLARYALAGDTVALAFIPHDNPESFRQQWQEQFVRAGSLSLKGFLKAFPLTQALANKIMAWAQLKPTETAAQLSRQKRQTLFDLLTAFPLSIRALGDFKVAMVTCGGVALEEVNAKTMESRRAKGLYFAGEVLDIDGDCGGYDLQAAWSTAALAAHSIQTPLESENRRYRPHALVR